MIDNTRNKMKKIEFNDTYPLFIKKIDKNRTSFNNVDEIMDYLRMKIEADAISVYIGEFDHYGHTSGLESHEIADNILDAKNIIFCFGEKLMLPEVAGLRPRSFGVVLTTDSFVISFLQAPNPQANAKMVEWVESVENR